jgi:hypothetical protein
MSRKICADVFDYDHAFTHGDGAMDYRRLIHRIKEQSGLNQTGLADMFGVEQPTISRWLRGSEPKERHAKLIREKAQQLRILSKDGETINGYEEDMTSDPELGGHIVAVVGYVGAGAEAHYYDVGQGPFGKVDMPPGGASDLVAVVVRGDSMGGVADDESVIYYRDRREPPTDDLYGKLCVCGLVDGRVLLKKLRPSRSDPRLFDLYSTTGATIPNQRVAWAAKVEFIKPS